MNILPLKQVPAGLSVREYRDTSWRGLFYAGILFGCIAVFVLFPKGSGMAWGASALPLSLSVLCLALSLHRHIRGAETGWLLKSAAEGVYINAAYSDGYPLPGGPTDALFIPTATINGIQLIEETVRLPYRFGATRHHLVYVDMVLADSLADAGKTLVCLHQICFRNAGKSGPFPILMPSPGRLRLTWGWVVPNARDTVKHLSESYTRLPKRMVFYPEWDNLDKCQQDLYLDELWNMGMTTESLYLGRIRHGISTREVRSLLEKRNAISDSETNA